MLNVTTAIKNMFKHDYLPYNAPVEKTLVLYFADLNLTITEDDIYNDEFEWNSELTGEELTFGDCNSDSLKLSVDGITDDIVGHQFTAKFVIGGVDYKIGTFIVSEAKCEDNNDVKKVVAYDLMSKFDVDVAAWYEALTFPVTLKSMRESLCTQCGVQYNNSNLPNDSLSISKTISTNQLNGRDVLKSLEQLNGCFGHMDRNGALNHIVLSQSSPVDEIDNTAYDELVLEEYTTDAISKVQIRQEDGDVGAYSGTGTNCYTITGNFLVYGKSAAELSTIANNVATNILGITYRPFECEMQGLLYLDVGDHITFSGNETVNTYLLKRTLTGAQILSDKASAKGDKELSEDTSLNVQVIQLKGKTNVLRRDVDGLSNTVTELSTNIANNYSTTTQMQSAIEQNNQTITTRVEESVDRKYLGLLPSETLLPSATLLPCSNTILSNLTDQYNTQFKQTSREFELSVNQVQGNVETLSAMVTLNATTFSTQITNLTNNTSTQIQQLANDISLKLTTEDLCNELSISTDGINITGNRFTWSATNSSMTADGTLTCANVNMSGTFSSTSAYGANVTMSNGQISLSDTNVSMSIGGGCIISNISGGTLSISPTGLSLANGSYNYNTINLIPGSYSNIGANTFSPYGGIFVNGVSVSLDGHSHSEYALSGHTHSGYALSGHTHSEYATTGWVSANFQPRSSSDFRLKRNIRQLDRVSDFISEMKPKSYSFKGDLDDGTMHYGLLAQELLKLEEKYGFTGFVSEYECRNYYDEGMYAGKKAYRIEYEKLIGILIKGMQELQEEIKEIRRKQNGN